MDEGDISIKYFIFVMGVHYGEAIGATFLFLTVATSADNVQKNNVAPSSNGTGVTTQNTTNAQTATSAMTSTSRGTTATLVSSMQTDLNSSKVSDVSAVDASDKSSVASSSIGGSSIAASEINNSELGSSVIESSVVESSIVGESEIEDDVE